MSYDLSYRSLFEHYSLRDFKSWDGWTEAIAAAGDIPPTKSMLESGTIRSAVKNLQFLMNAHTIETWVIRKSNGHLIFKDGTHTIVHSGRGDNIPDLCFTHDENTTVEIKWYQDWQSLSKYILEPLLDKNRVDYTRKYALHGAIYGYFYVRSEDAIYRIKVLDYINTNGAVAPDKLIDVPRTEVPAVYLDEKYFN